eukprot:TRINITY_DN6352_c0_g1_i1.p1 TRINITY_DN6352_c0_g1~~TRINITY_DN6352_c0_g1_i1.p1  ORF type:complete len:495 (+),score=56.32 TRINITY_DN6352_c0_g1_i1:122-1606(+)
MSTFSSSSGKITHRQLLCEPSQQESGHIFSLPSDLFLEWVRFADIDDVFQCCCVCKSWNAALPLERLTTLFGAQFDLPRGRTRKDLRDIVSSFRKLPVIRKQQDAAANMEWAVKYSQPRLAISILNEAVRQRLLSGISRFPYRLFSLGSVELAQLTFETFPGLNAVILFGNASNSPAVMHFLLDKFHPDLLRENRQIFLSVAITGNIELFRHAEEVCGPLDRFSDDIIRYSMAKNTPADLFMYLFNDLKWTSRRALSTAISFCRPELAEVILSRRGAPPNEEEVELCARSGNVALMELLLKYGGNVTGPAVFEAVKASNKDVLELLLKNGGTGRWTNEAGEWALLKAVQSQDIEMVKLLLPVSDIRGYRSSDGNLTLSKKGLKDRAQGLHSPLRLTCGGLNKEKMFEIAKALIDAGVDPSEQPECLQHALENFSFKIAGLFLSRGVPTEDIISNFPARFAQKRLQTMKLPIGKNGEVFKMLFQACIDMYQSSTE